MDVYAKILLTDYQKQLRLNKRMTKDKEKKSLGRRIGIGCLQIFIIFIVLGVIGGVVATKFMNSTKSSATKSYHENTVKLIEDALKECKSGGTKYLNYTQSCPVTPENIISAILKTKQAINIFDYDRDLYLRSSNNTLDKDVGSIHLSSLGSDVVVKSCNKKSCSKEENRQSSTVSIK